MIEWLHQLKIVEVIFGIAALLGSAIYGVMRWWGNREASRDISLKQDVGLEAKPYLMRLSRVEKEIDRFDESLARVEGRMTNGFKEFDARFHQMEMKMQSLARREDAEIIKVAQARLESRTDTLLENDRIMHERMNNLGSELSTMIASVMKKNQ